MVWGFVAADEIQVSLVLEACVVFTLHGKLSRNAITELPMFKLCPLIARIVPPLWGPTTGVTLSSLTFYKTI